MEERGGGDLSSLICTHMCFCLSLLFLDHGPSMTLSRVGSLSPISGPSLDGVSFSKISKDRARWLEREFSEEEILEKLKHVEGDKP